MKKISVLFIVLFVLFLFSCKIKPTKKNIEKSTENSLLKQTKPLKGEITLELEKVLSFDLTKSNPAVLVVNKVLKGEEGYYFTNIKDVKIFKYDKNGKFVREFLRKGQGPGELPYLMNAKFINNSIYALFMNKVIKFDKNGKLIFQKQFNARYYPIDIVDDNRVICEKFNMAAVDGDNKELKIIEIFDIKEEKPVKIAGTEFAGQITIKKGGGYVSFTVPALSPGIVWTYDKKNKRLYYANSNEYKITAMNTKGEKLFDFGKEFKPIAVDMKIINEQFGGMDKNSLESIRKRLPEHIMPIGKIKILASGNIAVYNEFAEAKESGIDIFDSKGNYIYRIKIPENLSLADFHFLKDGSIGFIEEKPERVIFTEYRVKKPENVF